MAQYPPRKTLIDGTWDNFGDTINLQNWLRQRGYYPTSYSIDGIWGYYTTRAIQQYLRTQRLVQYSNVRVYAGAIDGSFGPMTKGAMGDAAMYVLNQSYMNPYCGGGSCTIGWPNANVVKSWQRFLNRNFGFAG